MSLMESQSMWCPCRQHECNNSGGTAHTTLRNIIEVLSVVSAMASAVDGTGDGWMKCFVCKVQAQYGFARKMYGQQFSASGLKASKRVYGANISSPVCVCVCV